MTLFPPTNAVTVFSCLQIKGENLLNVFQPKQSTTKSSRAIIEFEWTI
jgi:hypothetical protein